MIRYNYGRDGWEKFPRLALDATARHPLAAQATPGEAA